MPSVLDKTEGYATCIRDSVLAKPHRIRRAGICIRLGIGDCGERGRDHDDESKGAQFMHDIALQFGCRSDNDWGGKLFLKPSATVIVLSDRNVIDAQLQDALCDFQRHWIKTRRSLARFSGPEASNRTPSLADLITTTFGFRFSVHTAAAVSTAIIPGGVIQTLRSCTTRQRRSLCVGALPPLREQIKNMRLESILVKVMGVAVVNSFECGG